MKRNLNGKQRNSHFSSFSVYSPTHWGNWDRTCIGTMIKCNFCLFSGIEIFHQLIEFFGDEWKLIDLPSMWMKQFMNVENVNLWPIVSHEFNNNLLRFSSSDFHSRDSSTQLGALENVNWRLSLCIPAVSQVVYLLRACVAILQATCCCFLLNCIPSLP